MFPAINASAARYIQLVIMVAAFSFSACSQEHKLAKQYCRNHKGDAVVIIPIYQLAKDNLTISYDTIVTYSKMQLDSIAWFQSCYIRQISDSIFLTRFTNSLIKELSREGFNVYVSDSAADFQKLPDPKWLVLLAQLQLNENHSITDYKVSTEKIQGVVNSVASLRLNTLILDSWIEASKNNLPKKQTLFTEESIMDKVTNGYDFITRKGNEGLQKNRDSLEMEDVYKFAELSGRKRAESLFDHFMNEYINQNLPEGTVRKTYYYFDRQSRAIKPGLNEWFEVTD
jgi:hypothetical protein